MASTFQDLVRPGCRLCPRNCLKDRWAGEQGFCRAGPLPVVSQAGPHHGEEPCLSGRKGSGTLFLCGCNLHCLFCQNREISCRAEGRGEDAGTVAETMLHLEKIGCHNINFVTPTHHADQVAEAIVLARDRGLSVPVVYNSGGYESVQTLRLLSGLVEIYMPDLKFLDPELSTMYLGAADYGEKAKAALKVMQAQVGDLRIEDGLAVKGLLIRHLVMPGCGEDAFAILDFIQQEVSDRAYVNVMGQYWPTPEVSGLSGLNQGVSRGEVEKVRERAVDLGLRLCE